MQSEWAGIKVRLTALDQELWRRATATSGMGPMRNVWSNAMLALKGGSPWRDVDYDRLRLAIHIDDVLRKRVRELEKSLWRMLRRRYFPEEC